MTSELNRFEQEDLDKNQQIDWEDLNQKYCDKHKRNYHRKCNICNKNKGMMLG